MTIIWMAISQDMPQPLITEFSLKITYVTLHLNLPGVSELSGVDRSAIMIFPCRHEIRQQYPNKFLNLDEDRIYVLNTLFNLPGE